MSEQPAQGGQVDYLNPATLHRNPAFTQVVVTSGPARTIYVGGQNAVDATGAIVGEGDITAQTRQSFANLGAALAAAGAGLEHIVRWTIYVVQGQPIGPGFAVFQEVWGRRPNPPATSCSSWRGSPTPPSWSRSTPSPSCRSSRLSVSRRARGACMPRASPAPQARGALEASEGVAGL